MTCVRLPAKSVPIGTVAFVKRTGDRLFLFVATRLAYVIPLRAFVSEESFQRFADEAEERWHSR
jgi:hypothetical protein